MASADRLALAALFRSTNGIGWTTNCHWDTDAELSRWEGVRLNEAGRVVELSLSRNNLVGAYKMGSNMNIHGRKVAVLSCVGVLRFETMP